MTRTQYTRPCEFCGESFTRPRPARFCSPRCSQRGRTRPAQERFWSFVDKSGQCWLWTGGKTEDGYGWFKFQGKAHLAHRFSYEMAKGPLAPGEFACHNCPGGDNPSCVNPAHLFPGTNLDNVRDAMEKGRRRVQGLPVETVREIRRIHAAGGLTHGAIAARFGLARETVTRIINHRRHP